MGKYVARAIFIAYVLFIFMMTHWPKLVVPGPEGTDKYVHEMVFGLWTILALRSCFFGPLLSARNIIGAFVLAALYAAFDESTQALPFIHRSSEFADYFANLKGIAIVTVGAVVWSGVIRTSDKPLSSEPDVRP